MTTYLGFKVVYHRMVDRTGCHLWTSPLYDKEWEPGRIEHATCDNSMLWSLMGAKMYGVGSPSNAQTWHHRHKAPAVHCNCGLHASWDLHKAAAWLWTQKYKWQKEYFIDRIDAVVAVVEGGGMVEHHETGFRAEQMLIKSVIGRLVPSDEGFYDAFKSGLTLEVLKAPRFEVNFPLWDPQLAILAVSENRRAKKSEIDV